MNKNEIVKYHNDLNELIFPDFKEQENNIFFSIVSKMQEKKDEVVIFNATEVSKFFGSAYPKEILAWMLKKMAHTMKTKGFVHISKTEKTTSTNYITMFPTFTIETEPNEKFRDDPMLKEALKELRVRINPDFIYLFNKLVGNFTAFELAEFIALSGKYTKTLYRLLKQFRSTGIAKFEWSEFVKILDIPESYQMRDIEKRILKPAIKELTKERNLFDQKRIPFINLAYEKIKENGTKGQGGKVIGITFTFKPENIELEKEKKELAHESEKITTIDNKILSICNKMVEGAYKFSYQDKTYKALSFDYENLTFSCVELIRNEIGFFDEKSVRTFQQKNKETFLTMLETFVSKIC